MNKATIKKFKTSLKKPFAFLFSEKAGTARNYIVKAIITLIFISAAVYFFPKGLSINYSDFRKGSAAPREVVAPYDFEIMKSEAEYNSDREEVRKNILPIFIRNDSVINTQTEALQEFYQKTRELNKIQKSLNAISKLPEQQTSSKADSQIIILKQQYLATIDSMTNVFREKYNININENRWQNLINYGAEFSKKFFSEIDQILRDLAIVGIIDIEKNNLAVLKEQLTIEEGDRKSIKFTSDFFDKNEALEKIAERFQTLYPLATDTVNVAYEIALLFIKPNIIYAKSKTEKKLDEKIRKIPLTKGWVLKNQKIVDYQQIIDDEIFEKIQSLRTKIFDEKQKREGSLLSFPILGKALFIALMLTIFFIYLYNNRKRILKSNKKIALIYLIILVEILLTFFVFKSEYNIYLIPTSISAILLTTLFDAGIGFYGTVVASFLIGAYTGDQFPLTFISLFTGLIAVQSVKKVRHRSQFFRTSLFLSLGYFVAVVSLGMYHMDPYKNVLLDFAIYALPNAFISPFIAMGLLALFEIVFGITTDMTLLELSDLNRPLLKQLALQAPGTFHHSTVVGNLAESAAEAIGVNSLLARVGSYYHDIGKVQKPLYFIENTSGEANNKHDALAPSMSSLILSSHVIEGLKMADQYKLPDIIKDFISQHHGTSVMDFFYKKALQKTEGKYVNKSDFRYPGPKPNNRETGIVMLADSVEAAVRSLKDPTPNRIEDMIGLIIDNKLKEGQLDDSDLTMRHLARIKQSFFKTMVGMHHGRVEYPDQEKKLAEVHEEQLMENNDNEKKNNNN